MLPAGVSMVDVSLSQRPGEDTPIRLRTVEEIDTQHRSVCFHNILVCILLASYGFTLSVVDGNRLLLSAGWREILQELHPDEPKDAERLTEGEVVPKWGEVLHADDVAKQLNWFQTFCRNKFGMDNHMEFFWKCNILDVRVNWNPNVQPLDRHMKCSARFIEKHIIKGDNPLCVPYGEHSLSQLQRLDEAQGNGPNEIGEVDEIYDEYTILEGNPMFEHLDERFGDLETQLDDIDRFVQKNSEGMKHRRLDEQQCTGKLRVCQYPELNLNLTSRVPCYCFYHRTWHEQQGRGKHKAEKPLILSVCRNHHWGLLPLCQPEDLRVRFFIERVKPRRLREVMENPEAREVRLFWYEITMVFRKLEGAISTTAGWYRTELVLEESEFYGFKSLFEGIVSVVACICIWVVLFNDWLWTIVLFPRNVRRLMEMKNVGKIQDMLGRSASSEQGTPSSEGTPTQVTELVLMDLFQERLMALVDGGGHRALFMSMIECVLENAAATLTFMGVVSSVCASLVVSIPSQRKGYYRNSPLGFVWKTTSGVQFLTEFIFVICFEDVTLHCFSFAILYFRILGRVLYQLKSTRWLPMTIILSSVRTMYFLTFFVFLVIGFAVIAYLQFGQRFFQFSTLKRAVIELTLCVCGAPAYVFEDMYPFQEQIALMACAYLAVFFILAVTIGMNFFTTILLDAYNVALDPDAAGEIIERSWLTILRYMMRTIGVPFEMCISDSSPPAPYSEVDRQCKSFLQVQSPGGSARQARFGGIADARPSWGVEMTQSMSKADTWD